MMSPTAQRPRPLRPGEAPTRALAEHAVTFLIDYLDQCDVDPDLEPEVEEDTHDAEPDREILA